jgi:hypothetical protein
MTDMAPKELVMRKRERKFPDSVAGAEVSDIDLEQRTFSSGGGGSPRSAPNG